MNELVINCVKSHVLNDLSTRTEWPLYKVRMAYVWEMIEEALGVRIDEEWFFYEGKVGTPLGDLTEWVLEELEHKFGPEE